MLTTEAPLRVFYRLTLEQLRDAIVSAGLLAEAEIDEALAMLADPAFTCLSPILISAWGRKP